MAIVTYAWQTALAPVFMTLSTQGPTQPAIAGNAAGDGYLGAWTQPGPTDDNAIGRVCNINGPITTLWHVASAPTIPGDQADVSLTGLSNNTFVAAFTDYGVDPLGDIRLHRFSQNGFPQDIGNDFLVDPANAAQNDREADVTGLSDSGFAATWTRDLGGGNHDICAAVYNPDGSVRTALVDVNSNFNNTSFSSVAGTLGGGFVVAWQEEPAAGGDSEVRFRRFNSAGTALDVAAGVLIDTAGSLNEDIQVAGLPDGGFVVAYTDNGWGTGSNDITVRVYNADGSPRTTHLRANTTAAGEQDKPALTVLSNGYFVVSWVNESSAALYYQAYDADGVAVGANFNALDSVTEGEIAALSAGLVANVSSSTVTQFPGDQDSIRGAIHELVRTTTGNATDETLTGDSLRDVIFGGDGDDTLNGLGGADAMLGGTDDDYYYVDSAGDLVVEGLAAGADRVLASVSYSLAAGAQVEMLTTTNNAGTAAIDLTGNDIVNAIYGNAGQNTLDGKGGADSLSGFGGADWYYVDNVLDVVNESAGGGSDRVLTSVSYTLKAGSVVELFTTTNNGGLDDLNLTGNELPNTIYGNAGENTLDGKGGVDSLIGFGGDDQYIVDNAGDAITESAGGGIDGVSASVSYTLGAGDHIELLKTSNNAGLGAINLTGNEFSNTIYGNAGANTLDGKGGGDTLVGLGGSDFFFVDEAAEAIMEGAGEGTGDRVFASVSYTLGVGDQVEIMSTTSHAGVGAINLTGNEFGNTIYGNAGANLLSGGLGPDTLVGFGGADGFLFNSVLGAGNVDGISDFSAADTMQLENAIFTTAGAPGALAAAAFRGGAGVTTAADANDRIIHNTTSGALYYDPDGNAAGFAPVQFAAISASFVLTNADFLVV